MRRLYMLDEMREAGLTRSAIRWGSNTGRWQMINARVYGDGPEDPTPLDRARAAVLAAGGVATGNLAGVLLEMDGVRFRGAEMAVHPSGNGRRRDARRRRLAPERVATVGGVPCTDGL